jgi:hypothetical protein
MAALPSYMYGDPADAIDKRRAEARKREQLRRNKARRIRALVKKAMKGKP